tara:strand:+ start:2665 stop:2982 length:318 start_codon:yes stop_codon:yes gene_type:complete
MLVVLERVVEVGATLGGHLDAVGQVGTELAEVLALRGAVALTLPGLLGIHSARLWVVGVLELLDVVGNCCCLFLSSGTEVFVVKGKGQDFWGVSTSPEKQSKKES